MPKLLHRPTKYTYKELKNKIDEYFTSCDNDKYRTKYTKDGKVSEIISKPYTVSGLAYFLDVDKRTISEWEGNINKGFSPLIKRAKRRIEEDYIQRGLDGRAHPILTMFIIKNHFGYKDKTEVEQSLYVAPVVSNKELEERAALLGLEIPASSLRRIKSGS